MSEWTKGPWETDDNMGVWATGGGMVGQFFHVSMGITLEQAEANARLAAAAPTMAEALATADAWLSRWGQHVGSCVGGEACSCGLTRLRFEVTAALTLAKGEDRNG